MGVAGFNALLMGKEKFKWCIHSHDYNCYVLSLYLRQK